MDATEVAGLLAGGPLLADGGMGTSLIARGAPVGACLEALNVEEPADVMLVHRGFVDAGARLILTNTFGANRLRLGRHGLADRVGAINRAGVSIARKAGAPFVGGSMGPLGVRLAPYGRVGLEDARAVYAEQAEALAEAGADLFAIETQSDLREIEQAVEAARQVSPNTAIMASATFTRDDRTLLGEAPGQVAACLAGLGVAMIGVNCGEGPAQVLRVLRAMRPFADGRPMVARPNAGGPLEIGGRFVYPATPRYVAEHALAFVQEGAAVVGGCCGTGPDHTAAIAAALASDARVARVTPRIEVSAEPAPPATAVAEPTTLEARLLAGDFVIAVEVEPPRSFNAARLVAAAGTLREAGADVVDVADSPMAKMRMSAWAACRLVEEQVGVETVLHFPTRGRNLLRLQGDLLGAHALGIRNLFVCVGDPVTIGDYPQGSGAVDVTATGLLALIAGEFNRGRDRAGSSIGEPTVVLRRRGGGSRGVRPPTGVPAPQAEGRCGRPVPPLAAAVRVRLARAPPRDLRVRHRRAALGAAVGRRPAARKPPARGLPPQRGAGHRDPRLGQGPPRGRGRRRRPRWCSDGRRARDGAAGRRRRRRVRDAAVRTLRPGGRAGGGSQARIADPAAASPGSGEAAPPGSRFAP